MPWAFRWSKIGHRSGADASRAAAGDRDEEDRKDPLPGSLVVRDVNKVRKVGVAVASCLSSRKERKAGGEEEKKRRRGGDWYARIDEKEKRWRTGGREGGEFFEAARPFSRARFVPLLFSPSPRISGVTTTIPAHRLASRTCTAVSDSWTRWDHVEYNGVTGTGEKEEKKREKERVMQAGMRSMLARHC